MKQYNKMMTRQNGKVLSVLLFYLFTFLLFKLTCQ